MALNIIAEAKGQQHTTGELIERLFNIDPYIYLATRRESMKLKVDPKP